MTDTDSEHVVRLARSAAPGLATGETDDLLLLTTSPTWRCFHSKKCWWFALRGAFRKLAVSVSRYPNETRHHFPGD
jgi:hypothetical protein